MSPASQRAPHAGRRELLGAASTLLLLGATEAGPAKAAELDGALLDAYRRWLPWEAERVAVRSLSMEDDIWDARFDAYTDPWHDGVDEIMAITARTPEGIRVKATVLRALLENHVGFNGPGRGTPSCATASEAAAWSLVRAMLGRAGA